jgi:hypothetical protein
VSDEALFVYPDEMFTTVSELRGSFAGLTTPASGLDPVSVSNAAASESLATLATLAQGLSTSVGIQLEVVSRLMTLGTLRVIAADRLSGSCQGP